MYDLKIVTWNYVDQLAVFMSPSSAITTTFCAGTLGVDVSLVALISRRSF